MLLTQGTEICVIRAFLHLSSVSPLFPGRVKRRIALNLPFRGQTLELFAATIFIGTYFQGATLDG